MVNKKRIDTYAIIFYLLETNFCKKYKKIIRIANL